MQKIISLGKRISTVNILAFTFLLLVLVGVGFGKSPEKNAMELMELGMYEQAKVLLTNEIIKEPKNSELHFLLGKCFLATDNIAKAQESFDRATLLDPKKGRLIGKAYFNEGKDSFQKGNMWRANQFFPFSVKYDPSLKSEVAAIFYNTAITNINNDNISGAETASKMAISYDSKTAQKISSAALARAKTIVTLIEKRHLVLSLGKFANTVDISYAPKWGNLLYQIITDGHQQLKAQELTELGYQAFQWNTELKDKIFIVYLNLAKKLLQSKEPDVASIAIFLRAANVVDKASSDQIGLLVWNELSKYLSDLKSLRQDRFLTLFNLCEEFGVSAEIKQSSLYELAYGLKLYAEGSRERSLSILKSLVGKFPNTTESAMASKVLSPLPIGKKEMDSKPFRFEGRQGAINIQLLYVDVGQDSIQITYSVRAGDDEAILLYAPKTWEERFAISVEGLYILDDNGEKLYSTHGFIGGRQSQFNKKVKQIELNPGEEVIISAKFPMISEGATSLKFVSPGLNGWQSEWWSGIKLKDRPFD